MRRLFPFAWYVAQRDLERPLRVFQLRDLAAIFQIAAALERMGYQLGELLLNRPDPGGDETLHPMDLAGAEEGDKLVLVTRPPLSDLWKGDRKVVRRGNTSLERTILELWVRFLRIISRQHVAVAAAFAPQLPPDRRSVQFFESEGARIKQEGASARSADPIRTLAFLLHLESIGPGKPGLVSSFALDGTSTLVWATLLRHRLGHLLEKPGFVVAELSEGLIPARPTDLSFALDWRVEILLHEAL